MQSDLFTMDVFAPFSRHLHICWLLDSGGLAPELLFFFSLCFSILYSIEIMLLTELLGFHNYRHKLKYNVAGKHW